MSDTDSVAKVRSLIQEFVERREALDAAYPGVIPVPQLQPGASEPMIEGFAARFPFRVVDEHLDFLRVTDGLPGFHYWAVVIGTANGLTDRRSRMRSSTVPC